VSKFSLRKWELDGRPLANPLLILWRLFWHLPYLVLAVMITGVTLLGQGSYAASQVWGDLM
jgi:hypothetical protein